MSMEKAVIFLNNLLRLEFNHLTIFYKIKMKSEKKQHYQCNKCRRSFWRPSTLRNHIVNFHPNANILKFKTKLNISHYIYIQLRLRMCTKLRKRKPYKCIECPKVFFHPQVFKGHFIHFHQNAHISKFPPQKGDDNEFSCPQCGRRFAGKSGKSNLQRHIALHSVKPNRCKVCSRGFFHKTELQNHMSRPCQRRYKCNINQCCRRFLSQEDLECHIAAHSARPYSCNQCWRTFDSEINLEHHIALHSVKPYCCNVCDKRFSKKAHLQLHIVRHSGKPYACKTMMCGKMFATLEQLKEHTQVHTGEFRCDECGRSYITSANLIRHKSNLKKPCSQKARCRQCGEWFIKIKDMLAHMKIHWNVKKYEFNEKCYNCKECPESFSQALTLKKHVAKFHPNAEIPKFSKKDGYKDEYLCSECGKCFSQQVNLNQHMETHHGKTRHHARIKAQICKQCDKAFNSLKSLKKHVRYAHGVKGHWCAECGNSFSQQVNLNQHMETHHGKTNELLCSECGKCFSRQVNLSQHMKTHQTTEKHAGIKAYICKQCAKAFSSLKSLKKHVMYAHGVRGHWCAECGNSFTLRSKLKEHMEQHCVKEPSTIRLQTMLQEKTSRHTSSSSSNLEQHRRKRKRQHENKGYICCQCGKGFVRFASYRTHMDKDHSGETGHICIACGKIFKCGIRLVRHMMESHSDIDGFYWCGECEERFTLKPDLTKHLVQHCVDQFGQTDLHSEEKKTKSLQNTYAQLAKSDIEVVKETGESFTQDAKTSDDFNEMCQICTGCMKSFVFVDDLELHLKVCQPKQLLSDEVAKKSSVPDMQQKSNENSEYIDYSNIFHAVDIRDTLHNQTETRENIDRLLPGTNITGLQVSDIIDRVRLGELNIPENQTEFDDNISEDDYVKDESSLSQCWDVLTNGKTGNFDSDTEIEDHLSENNTDVVYSTTYFYNCLECGETFSQIGDLQDHIKTHHEKDVLADPTGSITENVTDNAIEGSLIIKLFSCLECGERFTKGEDLQDHKQIHAHETPVSFDDNPQVKEISHVTNNIPVPSEMNNSTLEVDRKLILCAMCKESFTDRSAFNEHIKTHITASHRHVCTHCGKCFKERSHLRRHMLTHTADIVKPYSCEKCGKCYSQRRSLQFHMFIHTGVKFSCDKCEKEFANPDTLSYHMLKHTRDATYKCHCGKSFVSPGKLKKHMKTHKESQPMNSHNQTKPHNPTKLADRPIKHVCYKCGRGFPCPSNLHMHMLTHTDVKQHLCKTCGKSYKYKGNLTSHMDSHNNGNNPRKHICEECGKMFAWGINFRRHMNIHCGIKALTCSQCDKSFDSKEILRRHVKMTHSVIKPFACPQCDKHFRCKKYLSIHIKRHSIIKPYACSICDLGFQHQSDLNRHKQIHTSIKPFSCTQCNKTFHFQKGLRSHQWIHRKLKPHPCEICDNSYVQASQLVYHMKNKHSHVKP